MTIHAGRALVRRGIAAVRELAALARRAQAMADGRGHVFYGRDRALALVVRPAPTSAQRRGQIRQARRARIQRRGW